MFISTFERNIIDWEVIKTFFCVKARKGMEILLHDPIIIRRWDNLTDARKKSFLNIYTKILKTLK